MMNFSSYIKEDIALFQQEISVEEKVELLLEMSYKEWVICPELTSNLQWFGPYRPEELLDLLKTGTINLKWLVKKQTERNTSSKFIRYRDDLINIFKQLKDIRNKNLIS